MDRHLASAGIAALLLLVSASAGAVSRHVDLRVEAIRPRRDAPVVGARFKLVIITEGDHAPGGQIENVRVGLGSLDPQRWRRAGGGHGASGVSMKAGYLVHQWDLGPMPKNSRREVSLELDYAKTGLRPGQEVDVISGFLLRSTPLQAGYHTWGMALPMRDRSSVRTLPGGGDE